MSYILKWLPNKQQLIQELIDYPENLSAYRKYDYYGGDSDSVDYLRKKLKE